MDSSQQSPALHEAHIHLRAVGKSYPGGPQGVDALRAIDLQVRRGEIFGIIGRSGAGKSSLLRLLNRLETPSSGQVLIDGEDIARLDARQLARWRQRVGMIFQHFNLMASRTVWQNVAVPLRIAGLSRQEMAGRIDEVLRLVGLEGKHDAYPAQLSGGQKQRVGIARALVLEPEILLCDEATSALDPESTQDILGLLRDINARLGLTIVLITHEMAVIREICDRVIVLDAGRIVEQGEVWRVFGLPRHEVTRTLLGTLHHDLPDDLRTRLRSVSGEDEDELLLALHFTGAQGREPDLLAIGQALGVPTRLLHGGIERIQGHAQGRLLIAARIPHEAAALLQIRALADRVELLGYLGRECSPGNSVPTLCHAANSTPSL